MSIRTRQAHLSAVSSCVSMSTRASVCACCLASSICVNSCVCICVSVSADRDTDTLSSCSLRSLSSISSLILSNSSTCASFARCFARFESCIAVITYDQTQSHTSISALRLPLRLSPSASLVCLVTVTTSQNKTKATERAFESNRNLLMQC